MPALLPRLAVCAAIAGRADVAAVISDDDDDGVTNVTGCAVGIAWLTTSTMCRREGEAPGLVLSIEGVSRTRRGVAVLSTVALRRGAARGGSSCRRPLTRGWA